MPRNGGRGNSGHRGGVGTGRGGGEFRQDSQGMLDENIVGVLYSTKILRLGCVNSPLGQMEPGRGTTQPSLHLLAEHRTFR